MVLPTRCRTLQVARFAVVPAGLLAVAFPIQLHGQRPCPAENNTRIEAAWARYRDQDYQAADSLFGLVLRACPGHADAEVGRAYATLQRGDLEQALGRFRRLQTRFPGNIDALTGAGLTQWRRQRFAEALRVFQEVLAINPGDETALTYLARLTDVGRLIGRPPSQPAETLVYRSRTHQRHFDVRRDGTWQPFYINGINLGAALPGHHPSEFPDSATYARWIDDMAEVGFNAIRIYTNHPPHFYQALRTYNMAHPTDPLWLIHGTWTELPTKGRYNAPSWREPFYTQLRRTVDIVHGRADLGPAPDLAVPYYTADVSAWTLAFVIGREWEPSSLELFEAAHPTLTEWPGTYFRVTGGSPSEVLFAAAAEQIVQYETETYGHQRPVAFTSWPTLDPLHHPSETNREQQGVLRRALGYPSDIPERRAENDDEINVDPSVMVATAAMPAGTFAVFHAYPYYPDFLINDESLQGGRSPYGPSNYHAYLRQLRERLPNTPIFIGEYGVPTSLTNSHMQPQGWHHGGHSEQDMAKIDVRLTQEIAAAGMAGGAVFAWIDEWFKKNWLVIDFELPPERNRIWWNRLDPEQHYGMFAMEPEPRLGDGPLSARLEAWRTIPPLYVDRWGTIRATTDEAYLHLLFENADRRLPGQLLFGFDIVDPTAGDHRWPDKVGDAIPVGVEFVLSIGEDRATLVADSGANPLWAIDMNATLEDSSTLVYRAIEVRPPGFFTGRITQGFPDSVVSRPNRDGAYERLRVITNDTRIGRDTVEYAGLGYDRGILPPGPPPDGLWETIPDRGVVELRVPWMLLNFTDPSQRRVLQGQVGATNGAPFETVTVNDIGIVAAAFDGRRWRSWPLPNRPDGVARFTWGTWQVRDIRWRTRKRPVADALADAFRRLAPPVLAEHGAR